MGARKKRPPHSRAEHWKPFRAKLPVFKTEVFACSFADKDLRQTKSSEQEVLNRCFIRNPNSIQPERLLCGRLPAGGPIARFVRASDSIRNITMECKTTARKFFGVRRWSPL